jgi:outer membrane lipoprotein SlyB
MRKTFTFAMLAASALAITAGCASVGPQDYSYGETRTMESVAYGTIESVRPARLGEDHAPVGTVAGAAVGGVLGSTLARGPGGAVTTILGAVGGGLAGNALEHSATRQNGEEVVVRLDNGQTIAVVQGGWQDFAAGQRVQLVTGRGGSRVEHA